MAEELNPNPDKTQEARPCPKDCTKCGLQQHAFCSAQMSFYLVEKVNALQIQNEEFGKTMLTMANQISELISERQRNEELINPIQDIAQ